VSGTTAQKTAPGTRASAPAVARSPQPCRHRGLVDSMRAAIGSPTPAALLAIPAAYDTRLRLLPDAPALDDLVRPVTRAPGSRRTYVAHVKPLDGEAAPGTETFAHRLVQLGFERPGVAFAGRSVHSAPTRMRAGDRWPEWGGFRWGRSAAGAAPKVWPWLRDRGFRAAGKPRRGPQWFAQAAARNCALAYECCWESGGRLPPSWDLIPPSLCACLPVRP